MAFTKEEQAKLEYSGYRFVGEHGHAAAKICHWTRKSMVNEGVCYFDSSSKFPRFKLMESKFKRCIKPEKATVGIIGDVKAKVISRGNVCIHQHNAVIMRLAQL